jgi:hypothetical protein
MEGTAADCGAFSEAVVFLDYFKDLPDPRQRGKVLYPLDEAFDYPQFFIRWQQQIQH